MLYNSDHLYMYSSSGDRIMVKILNIHHDDPSAPYYTIGLPDDKGEKQTSLERLEKPGGSLHDLGGAHNVIDALFGIEMEQELTCNESTDESKVVVYLVCKCVFSSSP